MEGEVSGLMDFRQGAAIDKTGRWCTYAESTKYPGHHYIYVELAKQICKITSAVYAVIVPGS